MKRKTCIFVLLTLLLVTMAVSTGHTQNLIKRSRIELRLGLAANTGVEATVSRNGVTTTTETVGSLASLGFSRWLSEDFAVTIAAAALAVDVSSNIESAGSVTSSTSVITSISLGGRYYFPKSTYGGKWRPYAGISVGPVIGSETETTVDTAVVASTSTQTAFGSHAVF